MNYSHLSSAIEQLSKNLERNSAELRRQQEAIRMFVSELPEAELDRMLRPKAIEVARELGHCAADLMSDKELVEVTLPVMLERAGLGKLDEPRGEQ